MLSSGKFLMYSGFQAHYIFKLERQFLAADKVSFMNVLTPRIFHSIVVLDGLDRNQLTIKRISTHSYSIKARLFLWYSDIEFSFLSNSTEFLISSFYLMINIYVAVSEVMGIWRGTRKVERRTKGETWILGLFLGIILTHT